MRLLMLLCRGRMQIDCLGGKMGVGGNWITWTWVWAIGVSVSGHSMGHGITRVTSLLINHSYLSVLVSSFFTSN